MTHIRTHWRKYIVAAAAAYGAAHGVDPELSSKAATTLIELIGGIL